MPNVSVIVPNYNHARFLRQRLDSILAQTYQDFELILLDDCSTDESGEILREYASHPKVAHLEFSEKNSGSTFKQWNKGVRVAQGKYVWIAESDDYADSRLLERLVAILDGEPNVMFAYCRSWRVDEDGRTDGFGDYYLADLRPEHWASDYRAEGRALCAEYFVRRNIVPNASAVLFRKAAYEQAGGADESLRMCGDWKVWASMALTGDVAYISEPLSSFRVYAESIWGKGRRQGLAAEETLRVVRWMIERVEPSEQAARVMFEGLADALWIPAIASRQTPIAQKWRITRNAVAVDPRACGRLISGLAAAVRLKAFSIARGAGHAGTR